jgi:hypothetical protein
MSDTATLQSQVDELIEFKELHEELLEGLTSNGFGGFKAVTADIDELNIGNLICDTITVEGGSGNEQYIFNAEITGSIINESNIIGKGILGEVTTDNLSYFKLLRITGNTRSKNYLDIKNLGNPVLNFYNETDNSSSSSIDFYKNSRISDRILSTDEYFRIQSKNNLELKTDNILEISAGNSIKFSLTNLKSNIDYVNPIHIKSNINTVDFDTGSLIVDGGISVKKDLLISGNISVDSNINIDNNLNSDNINSNYINIENNCLIKNNIEIKGKLKISNASNYIKNEIDNQTLINNDVDSFDLNSGALIIKGGACINSNLNVGNDLYVKKDIDCLYNLNVGTRIGIGTKNVMSSLHFGTQDAIILPVGNNETRPNPAIKGMLRFNDVIGLEGYDGNNWNTFGGVRSADGTSEVYIDENKDIYFETDNIITGVMSRGKFGVGNTVKNDNYPSEILHVNGNLKIEGKLLMSDEADNQPLVGTPSINFDKLNDSINITANTTIANGFYNTEQYILKYLTGHPSAPILLTNEIDNISYTINFSKPQQFSFGFTNKLLPQLNNLHFQFKKSILDGYTTITTDNLNINNVKFILDISNNYIENNTYNIFLNSISFEDQYDFRIYYSNYKLNNDDASRDYNYLSLLNNTFNSTGPPEPPTNITSISTDTSLTLNFTKPNDHDIDNDDTNDNNGIQTLPLIKNYKITYNSISSNSLNFIQDDGINLTIAGNFMANAITQHTITNLNPGHTYDIFVQALNRINPEYSEKSTVSQGITDNPQPPEFINNKILSIDNTNLILYSTNGSLLNTNKNNIIVVNNNIAQNIIETNTLNNIRLNYSTNNVSSTDIISNFIINQLHSNPYTININGFNYITTDNTSNDIYSLFSNEGDFYTDVNKQGFYKIIDIRLKNVNIIPRQQPYYFIITQDVIGYNSYFTNEIEYYVDNLNQIPIASSLSLDNISNAVTEKISGITVITSCDFNFSLIIQYLASYFTRSDYKFSDLYLSDSFGNIFSNLYELKINDTNLTLIPNFTDINYVPPLTGNVNVSGNISLSIISTKYTNDLKLKSIPYNLFGIGNEIIENIYSDKILIDLSSQETLQEITNNILYGIQVNSGEGEYPQYDVDNDDNKKFGNNYNHNVSIIGTDELQLINGYFTSAKGGYLDYSQYFNNTLNYSSIIENQDYRYVTFKYNINDISTKTDNSLNIIKMELIGNNFDNIIEDDMKLFIKIHNTDNLSNLNTIWISGNNVVNGIGISLNNSNASYTDNNGIGGLSISGTYKSTNIIKYIFVPQGSKGLLYARIGIRNDSNKKIKFIKITET